MLELGCGTGLMSLLVAPSVRRLVAVDAADGMIAVLKGKLARPDAPRNVEAVAVMLEDPEDGLLPPADADADVAGAPRLKFDLITSHLVMHHIPDLQSVLRTMLGCLKPGGMVALTDFEDFGPDARRFHPAGKMDGVVRHGINRAWMEALMRDVGFVDVRVDIAWEHQKLVERHPGQFDKEDKDKGEMMTFPFVICLGKRPS